MYTSPVRGRKGTPTQEGSPDEAFGFADGRADFTLSTQPRDGVQFTVITVPKGVSGEVSIREVTERDTAPRLRGARWVGQRVDLVAPSASARTPLRLEIYVEKTRLKGRRVDGRSLDLYHSDTAEAAPVRLPRCERPAGQAVPDRCLSSARTVRRDGVRYVRLVALATDNGSWRPG